MRVMALLVAALVLAPAGSHAARTVLSSSQSRSPLPEDIALSLPSSGIEVIDAPEVDARSLRISARLAERLAWRSFGGMARPYPSGWVRVDRVTVHLVRVLRSNT